MSDFRGDKRVSPEEETLTSRILGAAVTVHRILGPGYVESIYHRALEKELANCSLEFESERDLVIWYDGIRVGEHRLDLVVRSQVVVELKAVSDFTGAHYAQLKSYLRAAHLRIGLLLNFADGVLRVRRILNEHRPLPSSRPPE